MAARLTPHLRLVALGALMLALAGCESWNPFADKPPPPLPGERFPVLQYQQNIAADPRLADLSVELPKPETNPAWPQAGGYPNHDMAHLALGADPKVIWSASIGSGSSKSRRLLAQPVVADGKVFTMDARARVAAFNAQTGDELWRVSVLPEGEDEGEVGGGIAYDKGRLFVATGAAEVLALDANSGKDIWRTPVPAPVHSAPTIADGKVFAVTVENELQALGEDDGKKLWFHTGLAESASFLGGASPAVDRNVVVVPHTSGELFALRVENGRPIWSDGLASIQRVTAVAALADIRGDPVIDRGLVFAVSNSGRMAAIDLRTGNRVWDLDVGALQTPWIAGDYVYVLTNNGEVLCVRRDTGRVRWATVLGPYVDKDERKKGVFWAGPVLAGDRLIVTGSHGEALSISPYTGKVLGWIKLNRGVMIAPIVANNTLYVLDTGGRLTAMR
ncbi:MAG: PQQ-binding-like beta-propeller repeat protein [Candidatus Eiseniibacteriota bacterium]